jgi:hypothetical protein
VHSLSGHIISRWRKSNNPVQTFPLYAPEIPLSNIANALFLSLLYVKRDFRFVPDEKHKYRSAVWFAKTDEDGFAHRSWMRNQGLPDHVLDGRPGICDI